MRITAGNMRGRTMHVPDIEGLRPTPSRVREALFNILGDIHDKTMLDLFAGSGVIGLEALSRGSAGVTSVDMNRQACQAMTEIKDSWPVTGWDIRNGKLPQALPAGQYFDLVFADPPYGQGVAEQIPGWLEKANITYDTLVIEESSRSRLHWKQGFEPGKQRRYSETTLYFFEAEAA